MTTSTPTGGSPDGALELLRLELAATRAEAHRREAELVEQQTVMADILRVIANSPANVQNVLDDVATQSRRLIAADSVSSLRREGDRLSRRVAVSGAWEGDLPVGELLPWAEANQTRHAPDLLAESAATAFPVMVARNDAARREGRPLTHVFLSVPLLREGEPIGSIRASRQEPRPFSEREIKLLEAFASQAVVAIENARLFSELQDSNRTLGDALEQQTATAEVLRVIASNPEDP